MINIFFLEKITDMFGYYFFDIMYNNVLSRGVTINYSLETPLERPKFFKFLNIHLIKN